MIFGDVRVLLLGNGATVTTLTCFSLFSIRVEYLFECILQRFVCPMCFFWGGQFPLKKCKKNLSQSQEGYQQGEQRVETLIEAFLSLALICGQFFVPSISEICLKDTIEIDML